MNLILFIFTHFILYVLIAHSKKTFDPSLGSQSSFKRLWKHMAREVELSIIFFFAIVFADACHFTQLLYI